MKINYISIYSSLVFVLIFSNYAPAQSLDSLLKLVVKNNTELQTIEAEYKAILAKKNQVNQLSNPQIGIGIPLLSPETRLGPQKIMLSASQAFPWFGTLSAKEDVILSMSKAKFQQFQLVKLELFYQVKYAYHQLIYLNNHRNVIQQNIKLTQQLETILIAKTRSNQSKLSDVLRVQIQLQELTQQIPIISNKIRIQEATINSISKQSVDTKINLTHDLFIPLLEFDIHQLQKKIASNHPIINQIGYKIEQSKQEIIVSNKSNNPSFQFGIDYAFVSNRTDSNPVNNGRDIFIPRLSLSIPIYRKSHQAKIEEENYNQQAMSSKKQTLIDQITSQLIQYKAEYDNALLLSELKEQQKIKLQSIYALLLSEYSTYSTSFEELLLIQKQLLEVEFSSFQAQLTVSISQAGIERITQF